jgi:long-chain acyl-CoA synthetase
MENHSPSLARFLVETAARYPDRVAVRFTGQETTFVQLEEQSNRLAHALKRRGYGQGDRIALYCVNSPHFMISYFGILKAGCVVVPVNLLLHPKEVTYLLRDSEAKALIYDGIKDEVVSTFRSQLTGLSDYIVTGLSTQHTYAQLFEAVLEDTSPDPVCEEPDDDEVAALLYTGGTTGLPKGAMLTHQNLRSNVQSVIKALKMDTNRDVFITVLPMFHSFGATVGFLAPIAVGSTVVALPQFAPESTCAAIQNENATVFLGVPTMYAMMANLPSDRNYDLSRLRTCITGGAAMPLSVLERFEKRYQISIYEGYGPTECSPVVSVNPVGGRRKLGTVGIPIPDVQVRILDQEGKDLDRNTVGEICVHGPNVMKGYWKRPEETQQVFWGEWIRTGDLGSIDEDNYITIVDRAKDLIIVHGINVYPRQVEDVIYQHPSVSEVAVIGIPDELHGEQVKAFVTLRDGESVQPVDIIRYCRDHLGRFEIPRRVEIVESLPKSGAGKILRRKLRDMERERRQKHMNSKAD